MHQPHSVLHSCLESLLCFAMPLRCTGVGAPISSSERSCMPRRIFIILWLFNDEP